VRVPPVAGIERNGTASVVRLRGELDLYNAHEVREVLLTEALAEPERIVVELSDVVFVDSTVLGVLIEARTKLPNHRAFLLAAPPAQTRRALELAGLEGHFGVHDTLESALAADL
jgi:anti-sigma B factor antagonist